MIVQLDLLKYENGRDRERGRDLDRRYRDVLLNTDYCCSLNLQGLDRQYRR